MEKSTYNKYLTENIIKNMKNQTETKSTKPTLNKEDSHKVENWIQSLTISWRRNFYHCKRL